MEHLTRLFTLGFRMKRRSPTILICLFFTLIALPLILTRVHFDFTPEQNEKRVFASYPTAPKDLRELSLWPGRFTHYFNDHFALRNTLIQISHRFFFQLLNSPPQDSVIIGKGGWLFFSGENSLDDYRNVSLFSEEELKKWAAILTENQQKASAIGAHFYFLVAPNAATIYGEEFLPAWIKKRAPHSRLDQLSEYLAARKIPMIDLRDEFKERAKTKLIYQRTDTHWNDLGAFYAYRQLMAAIQVDFPQVKAMEEGDFSLQSRTLPGGDLSQMLGFPHVILEKEATSMNPMVARPKPNTLRVQVYRDSFYNGLEPFFAPHFKETESHMGYQIDWKSMEVKKPNVIVLEMVERRLSKNVLLYPALFK